jgi:hypothetical protein
VKPLKANAKTAKDPTRQLKAQPDMSAERMETQKSRSGLTQAQRSALTSTIQLYR